MFKTCVAIGLFAARIGSAQSVAAPVAGLVLEKGTRLVPVRGVFGTLLRGDAIVLPAELAGVPVSAAFSDTAGLLKSTTAFVITDGSGQTVRQVASADPAVALASFGADGSVHWFCAGSCFSLQNTGGRTLSTSNTGGTVIALGVATQTIPLLTLAGKQLWSSSLSVADQSVSNQIAISGGMPAIAFNGGWLTTSSTGLIWTDANGAATAIPTTEPVQSLQAASSRTVCINAHWMLNSAMLLLEIPARPRRGSGRIPVGLGAVTQ